MKKLAKKVTTFVTASALAVSCLPMTALAYGEYDVSESTFKSDTDSSTAFQTWRDTIWSSSKADSGKIALTPGATEKDLNFAWYSENKGTPAVRVWKDGQESEARVITGTAADITAENWQGSTYAASNKVTVSGYFEENTKYHYQYTDNYMTEDSAVWSQDYTYTTGSAKDFSVILTGDPQIGASGSSDDYSDSDSSAARDTYNWNLTMEQALKTDPDAAFLLSAGDQIDKSGVTKSEDRKTRESEYAGYLYPAAFRSLPIAATIGNHDMAGVDYTYHFNTPNAEDGLGATAAGSDYYFSYGDVLFISLNSNNRNQEEHRALMEKAVESNPDAVWKVVIFHSDIYGSGEPHADTDASTNRIIFAPLMDEFDIDVCLTGHDHTYSRSYQILDGNVIDYDISDGSVTDPEGTLYITTGSGSGSKYYNLLNYTPYYIAERTNACLPAFSTLDFTEKSLTINTYDYNGEKYADTFTINKNQDVLSVDETIKQAEDTLASLDTAKYTEASVQSLRDALDNLKAVQDKYATEEDPAVQKLSEGYGTENDPSYGYGFVTNQDDKDFINWDEYYPEEGWGIEYYSRFKQGYSTLLDKTYYLQANEEELPIVEALEMITARDAVTAALASLQEIEEKNPAEEETSQEPVTEKEPVTDAETESGQIQPDTTGIVSQPEAAASESVKTGDNSGSVAIMAAAGLIIAAGAVFAVIRKREENCEAE